MEQEKKIQSSREAKKSKMISRRDFLKRMACGVISGTFAGGILELFNVISNLPTPSSEDDIMIPLTPTSVGTAADIPITQKVTPISDALPSTPESNTKVLEKIEPTKEYGFKIGEVSLDKPFSIVLPGTISGDLGYPDGLEILIKEPVANREKKGWPLEMTTIYEDYQKHPNSALVTKTDISGHLDVNLHSYSYKGNLLPGEVFRRVQNKNGLVGQSFQLFQLKKEFDKWVRDEISVEVEIVDESMVDGLVYEKAFGDPNASGSQEYVFARSDKWNLKAGDAARQPNQVTFVTCDGVYVEGGVTKFAKRFLITTQLIN